MTSLKHWQQVIAGCSSSRLVKLSSFECFLVNGSLRRTLRISSEDSKEENGSCSGSSYINTRDPCAAHDDMRAPRWSGGRRIYVRLNYIRKKSEAAMMANPHHIGLGRHLNLHHNNDFTTFLRPFHVPVVVVLATKHL